MHLDFLSSNNQLTLESLSVLKRALLDVFELAAFPVKFPTIIVSLP